MIPLMRPIVPNPRRAVENYQKAMNNRVFSNFGPLSTQAEAALGSIAGGHVLLTTNGTSAIEVAIRSLDLPRGSKIGLPDFTHAGTLLAIVRSGHVPVLFGVDPETWSVDPKEVLTAYSSDKIVAFVVVSPFGYCPGSLADWHELSSEYNVPLVYDFAGAWGNFFKSKWPICFSLHATKNMGIGEGGFVVFPTIEEKEWARKLTNFDTQPDRTIGSLDGYNYKMDELRAASILAGLDPAHASKVRARIAHRRSLLDFYRQNIAGSVLPSGDKYPSLCVLGGLPADQLEAASSQMGLVCKRYYPLLSRMAATAHIQKFSASRDALTQCLALPSDVDLATAYTVVEAVNDVIAKLGRQ